MNKYSASLLETKVTNEWKIWYRGYRKIIESIGPLTPFDLGVPGRTPAVIRSRWGITSQPNTEPMLLEETPVIPFWHGEMANVKLPWWRKPLDFFRHRA